MRHLGSLLLSIVLTVAWYLILGLAYSRYLLGHDGEWTGKLIIAGGLLIAAGLYSILILTRLSPVGLVLVGLALLVLSMWAVFGAPDNTPFDHLPKSVFGQKAVLSLPFEFAAFAAVPMVLTVFSPRRWRKYANPRPAANAYSPTPPVPLTPPPGGYPPPPQYGGQPSYGSPVDPFGGPVDPVSPVSPGGSGPDGTRVLPGPASPTSGSGYPPPAGGPAYPPPSSGSAYPSPSLPSYPPPASPSYGFPPPSTPTSTPPGSSSPPPPLWPSGPGTRNDPDATRPI